MALVTALSGAAVIVAADDAAPALVARTGGGGADKQWESLEARQKAADAGDPVASYEVGESLLTSEKDRAADVPRALTYLEKAAEGGSARAAFRLGKLHDDGEVVEKDYAKAKEFYLTAARLGSPEAQYNLGAMYVSARGVKRDFVEGLAWFIVAAKNGAEGEGEKQVRERLASTNRAALISAGEARAAALAKELPAFAPAKPVVAPPAPPRADFGQSGAASGKPKAKLAPPKLRPIAAPTIRPAPPTAPKP